MRPEAVLASNTSSISITRIAGQTRRPSQVIGQLLYCAKDMTDIPHITIASVQLQCTYQICVAISLERLIVWLCSGSV